MPTAYILLRRTTGWSVVRRENYASLRAFYNGPLTTANYSSGTEGGYGFCDAIEHFEHCDKFSDI
jgi:hypothetical protein